jgi:hypothetical protein
MLEGWTILLNVVCFVKYGAEFVICNVDIFPTVFPAALVVAITPVPEEEVVSLETDILFALVS